MKKEKSIEQLIAECDYKIAIGVAENKTRVELAIADAQMVVLESERSSRLIANRNEKIDSILNG